MELLAVTTYQLKKIDYSDKAKKLKLRLYVSVDGV